MAFERFENMQGSRRAKITLRENGQIGFSGGAIKRFNLAESEFCELYYDVDAQKIGLRFVNKEEEGITGKLIKRNQNFYISARPFLDEYGISYSPARSFIAMVDDANGMIIIDLTKQLPSKRKKKGGFTDEK